LQIAVILGSAIATTLMVTLLFEWFFELTFGKRVDPMTKCPPKDASDGCSENLRSPGRPKRRMAIIHKL
jgi:hypothetical protein